MTYNLQKEDVLLRSTTHPTCFFKNQMSPMYSVSI